MDSTPLARSAAGVPLRGAGRGDRLPAPDCRLVGVEPLVVDLLEPAVRFHDQRGDRLQRARVGAAVQRPDELSDG
jgi:hypothetical protein